MKTLIRMPSISTDPQFAESMKDAREFLLARLREIGMQNVQLLESDGQPAVFGEWTGAPGRPTLIVYGHYDVQPADPLELWQSPPFEPTQGSAMAGSYARGASDVKGSTTIAIETIGAFLAVAGACPVNVKLFLEGEEECGSPSLRGIVERNRQKLDADAMLSADGGRASTTVPTLGIGGRGIAALEFTLRTAGKDGHSGQLHGGAARNALHEMAALIASLHDLQGRILVANFGDDAMPISNAMRVAAAALPVDEAEFYGRIGGTPYGDPALHGARAHHAVPDHRGERHVGAATPATARRPVLPGEAHAKITMRLAPGMDPRRAGQKLRAHLQASVPEGVEITLTPERGGTPAPTLPDDHPLLLTAGEARSLSGCTGRKRSPCAVRRTLPSIGDIPGNARHRHAGLRVGDAGRGRACAERVFRLSSFDEGLRSWPMLLSELGNHTGRRIPAPFRPSSSA